jgi:hypothetical protein
MPQITRLTPSTPPIPGRNLSDPAAMAADLRVLRRLHVLISALVLLSELRVQAFRTHSFLTANRDVQSSSFSAKCQNRVLPSAMFRIGHSTARYTRDVCVRAKVPRNPADFPDPATMNEETRSVYEVIAINDFAIAARSSRPDPNVAHFVCRI